jgi:hypothetical protein
MPVIQRANGEIGRMSHRFEVPKILQYLKEREKKEGGFSFAPDLYPDIEDTYYSIRIFQMLRARVNRGKTANYLKGIDWGEVGFPRAIYMLVYLHLSLNIDFPPPLTDLLKRDWARFQTLDAQYFSDEVQKLLNGTPYPLQPLSHFQFDPKDNLQTLRKKVSILLNHGMDFDRQEIIKWVQRCQNGDGGFGFYPETTSYMENTYCALEILSNLHSFPMELELCRKYILGCQTKSGGFGRAPSSFPFIESTFHAVMGLFLLEKMGGEEV